VNAKDSTLFDLSLASAFFDGKVGDARAEVRQLTVDGPDIVGTASGTMAFDDAPGSTAASDLSYRFTVPDLARLGKRVEQPFAGRAELGGKLTGNFSVLETTGTAHIEPARYGDTAQAAIVDATYKVRLPDLDIENVRVESHVEASTIAMPAGGTASAAVAQASPASSASGESRGSSDSSDSNAAPSYTIEKLSSDLTYEKRELTFNGRAIDGGRTLDAKGRALLQDGRQEVRLASAALSAAGITWRTRDNAEALIVHDGATVAVTGLQVVNGEQQVTADGVVGVKKGTPSTLKILAENVDLAQAATLSAAVDPKMTPPDPRLAGRLSANARVTGTLQEPAVAGTFSIVDGAFREVKYQSFGGQVSYDRQRIGVDVKLEQSPGTALTARGSLPLSLISGGDAAKASGPEDVVDLLVQSTPIDLGLIQGLTTAVTDVTGRLQLDMRVKGRGRDVAFDGFVKVEQGAFAVTSTGARYTGLNTALQFEPSRLVVDGLRILDDGNDPLEVKGILGLTGTRFGSLDLTAHAKSFEVLHNEMGEVDVNMDLKIGGEIAAPTVSGTIATEGGRVEVDRLLRRLTAGAYSTESEALIPAAAGLRESAVASIPTSRPVPNPTLPPTPGTPPPGTATATTPGATTPAAPSTAQAGTPAQATPAAPGAVEDAAKAAKAAGLSILNRMRIDVRASIPDNLILRGKDLRVGTASMGLGNINVTVGGDLRIMRQPGTPTLVVGSVNTVRGSYDYRGRRFDILRDGRITFQGPRIEDPALDVTAQRVIEPMGIEARIHIEGTARRPQLRFSSNPPMDESDVIALIIFNRPLSDLESGERGAIADVAGSAVGGLLVSPLTDTIGRALNLDVFEVGTTTTDTGGTGGSVTVGKQVEDNLFFRFRQQFGSQEVSEFILEYQLARFLRLQAAFAEGEGVGRAQRSLTRRIERAGLDLIFYFSY
jgi:autotransporter translocation and assembly factor TamB